MLAATIVLLGTAAAATASTKMFECQHPTTTGEEAYDLQHVSGHTACKVVRKLAEWLYEDHHVDALYRCKRPNSHSTGTPVLKQHSFDGWRLHISPHGSFVMSRGERSFKVIGTDFPLNCT